MQGEGDERRNVMQEIKMERGVAVLLWLKSKLQSVVFAADDRPSSVDR
jgi:hypothetical protein